MAVKTASMFIFPWSLVDGGVDEVLDELRGLGITCICLVSQYHAGYFLYGHNPKRKVHLLEDGVAYFHPTEACYARSRIKPIVASMCAETDWFGVISEKARAVGFDVTAWTVCLHNTRLGLAHPEVTIHNVYGDSYPHALTPAHRDARAFVTAVVTDLCENYPIESVLPEAPNYRNRAHGADWVSGHHHERDGVYLRPLEQALMNLSFNPADEADAREHGVDVDAVKSAVRGHMDRYFDMSPEPPTALAETKEQFLNEVPALADLEANYARIERDLLTDLHKPMQGNGVKMAAGPGPASDIVNAGGYGLSVEETGEAVRQAKAGLLDHQELRFTIRIGFNDPSLSSPIVSQQQTCDYVKAIADNGADGVGFYNYAESARKCVQWIGPALRGIGMEGR